jgi:hypothetical protein
MLVRARIVARPPIGGGARTLSVPARNGGAQTLREEGQGLLSGRRRQDERDGEVRGSPSRFGGSVFRYLFCFTTPECGYWRVKATRTAGAMKKPRTLDRGDIAPGGEADGEGGAAPLPCLAQRSTLFISPTPPALRAPPPPRGAGAVRGDIPSKSMPGD